MMIDLAVRLTDQEMLMQAEALAKTLGVLSSEEADAKETASAAKSRIKELEIEVAAIAKVVREKSEYRPVECKEAQNFERKTMDLARLDTGEVVSYRPMRESEMQVALFEVPEEKEEAG